MSFLHHHRKSFLACARSLSLIGLAASCVAAHGQISTWTGSVSSSWTTAGNWSPTGVPGLNTIASIDHGTVTLSSGVGRYGVAGFGTVAGASSSFLLEGGVFTGSDAVFGYASRSQGTVSVSSGTWNYLHGIGIGYFGTGQMTVTGGVLSGADISLGEAAGAVGSLLMTGGTLNNSDVLYVGNAGRGTVTITGGSFHSGVSLGAQATGQGSLTLSGGSFSASGMIVGGEGRGTLVIQGGVSTIERMSVGDNGGTGSVTITQGFIQSGTLTNSLSVSKGSFLMTGGTYNTGEIRLGATEVGGTFTLSGGVLSGTTFAVFGVGNAVISGGTLRTALGVVGQGGAATLRINGGLVDLAGPVTLAESYSTDTGSILLNGGTLTAAKFQVEEGSGKMSLNGGVLQATADEADYFSGFNPGNVRVDAGGAFLDTGTHAVGIQAALSGAGALHKLGAGTLTLSGANSFTGGVMVEDGLLKLASPTALGAAGRSLLLNGSLELGGNSISITSLSGTNAASSLRNSGSAAAAVTLNQSGSTIYAGQISDASGGPLSLVRSGNGTLTLTGSNSYRGGTKLAAGALNLGNAYALGSGPLSITGAVVLDNTSGSAMTLGHNLTQAWNANFTFKGSNDLDLGTGDVAMNATRAVTVSARSLTVGGVISGSTASTGLVKTGLGSLVLTGNNTYSGATTISQGLLQLGIGGTSGSILGATIANNGTLGVNRSDDLTLGQTISGAGRLVKDGAGTLSLSGVNSYSGGTVLNGGGLILSNARSLGALSGDLTVNSGTLTLAPENITVGALSGTGGVIQAKGNVVEDPAASSLLKKLTVNSSRSSAFAGSLRDDPNPTLPAGSYSSVGVLSARDFSINFDNGDSGNLVVAWDPRHYVSGVLSLEKAGSGILTLSGSSSYSGGTVLKAGGLALNNAYALGTGALTIAGASTLDNTSGAALTLATNNAQAWNANFTFKGSDSLNLGTGDVTMNATRTVNVASGTLTVGGVISGSNSAGLVKTGAGTFVVTAFNTYSGVTTISQGTYQVGDGGSTGSHGAGAVVDNATLAFNLSDNGFFRSSLGGSGRLVQMGTGTLTITGTNSYSGGTVINQGKLVLGNARALGAATGDLTFGQGTLDLQGYNLTVGLLSGPGGVITNDAANPAILTTSSAKSGSFMGVLQDGAGGLALVKAGSGTLALSGSNSYTGGTTLAAGGLALNNAYALGSGPLTIAGVSTLDNTSGGALTLATNNAQAWNANFTFRGSNDLDLGTGDVKLNATRTVTVAAKSLTVGGVISGSTAGAGLTKSGLGTLILTGNNAYTGVTTISQGVLQLGNGGTTGSLASTQIVNNGTLTTRRSDAVTLSANISGRGVVRQAGVGALTLSGANTYTGGTILDSGELHVGSAKALGLGSLTLHNGLLATDGTQRQITVASNLLWDSDAKISLTLTGDAASESVKVGGSLIALDGGLLTFVLDDAPSDPGSYLVMTAARGFSGLTASRFTFESNNPDLSDSYFSIVGNNLYFVTPSAMSVASASLEYSASTYSYPSGPIYVVPEPSTWALLALALAALPFFACRLRRA